MATSKNQKITIYPGINDTPIAATAELGGNGADMVARINALIDIYREPIDNTIIYYFDFTNGLDTNDGLSVLTPLKDLNKGFELLENLDLKGHNIIFQLMDGTHTPDRDGWACVDLRGYLGSSRYDNTDYSYHNFLTIQGNAADNSLVNLTSCFYHEYGQFDYILIKNLTMTLDDDNYFESWGGVIEFENVKFTSSSGITPIWAMGQGKIIIWDCTFAGSFWYGAYAGENSLISFFGTTTFDAGCTFGSGFVGAYGGNVNIKSNFTGTFTGSRTDIKYGGRVALPSANNDPFTLPGDGWAWFEPDWGVVTTRSNNTIAGKLTCQYGYDNLDSTTGYQVNGTSVLKSQGSAIADPASDVAANNAAIIAILTAMRNHGLIAT